MVNMTLALPEQLQRRMKNFHEIKWSEVARRAIEQRLQDLEEMNKIAAKSRLTAEDAKELSRRISKAAAKRFLEA